MRLFRLAKFDPLPRSMQRVALVAIAMAVACGPADAEMSETDAGGAGSFGSAGADSHPAGSQGAGAAGAVPNARAAGWDAIAGRVRAAAGAAPSGPVPHEPVRDVIETRLYVDLAAERGVATITLAPSATTGASLEVGDLVVRAVRVDGQAIAWVDTGRWLDMDVPASTEPREVAVDYDFARAAEGSANSWPYLCGDLFPCHSDPADGTTFRLDVRGAPGTLLYPSEIATDAPAYMVGWISGDYTKLELGRTQQGTNVAIWHLPNRQSAAVAGGAHLAQAFDWLERNLGAYRFGSQVGSVERPSGVHGGMEHHPFWHVSSVSLGQEQANVHEAIHGWFGNGVRLACWEDFVLSEGTVSYLTARILEEVAGSAVSDPIWAEYAAEAGAARRAWARSCGDLGVVREGIDSRAPHVKGALFYRAVEDRVGRPALDAALRTFYERWAGSAARMQDMLDVIAEVTGYDPNACASNWLETRIGPAYVPCH